MSPGRGEGQEGISHEHSGLNVSSEREDDETSSRSKDNEMDFVAPD